MRLWKRELQRLADETGLTITVSHLPPGTSKWNKIEHRLFAFITQNWRGKPLVSHQVIVQLIGATTTETGLKVCCEIDGNLYPRGIKVTDAGDAGDQPHARRIPRRMELHHIAKSTTTLKRLFLGGPLGAWETMDRLVTSGFREGDMLDLIDRIERHLAMVFHRFLENFAAAAAHPA